MKILKGIIVCFLTLMFFSCSENAPRQDMPLRYANIFNTKYKNVHCLYSFVGMADRSTWEISKHDIFTDKWLYDNLESKGRKYILVSYIDSPEWGGIVEWLNIEKSSSPISHDSITRIQEISKEMFMESSKLAYMATKDEVMVDGGDLLKFSEGFHIKPSMVTYFDGKRQWTAYFCQPEYVVLPESEFRTLTEAEKVQKKAALYIVYMYKYCFIGLVRTSLIEDDKELYEKIEDDMQKALKEIPDKLVE